MPKTKQKYQMELLERRLELTRVIVAAEANPKDEKIQIK